MTVKLMMVEFALHTYIYILGQLFDRVVLIKPVSNVRQSIRTYVRPSTKSVFDFKGILHVGRGR